MQEENNNTAGDGRSLNWWLRLIAATTALFAILIALYAYMFIYGGWGMVASIFSSPAPEMETNDIAALPDLEGGLFLSAMVDRNENGIGFVPVVVLPSTHDFVYVPVDQLSSGPIFSLQHTLSTDLTKMTFLGWPLSEDYQHQTPSIYRADSSRNMTTTNYSEIIQEIVKNIQTTASSVLEPDEEDYFRQGPVVSNDGSILYSSLDEAEFDPEPSVYGSVEAEEWTIYKIDPNNTREVLTNGLAPKWIDETRFAFLKNDGIYLYNINTNEEKLIWSLNFVPTLIHAFDVSDDGQLLAIANPEAEIVTILESKDWEKEFPLEVLSEVSTKASGLTFAADNSYLAMLLLMGSNGTGTEGFARLSYYALDARKFHDKYIDLEDPQLQGLYMPDWK